MRKYFGVGIILLFALIACADLLHSGFPITHDGQDHIARIANFYQSLSEGILVPRWAANLNWGYGHPILEFLYPLPSYLASFFHFLTFSFIDSFKLVFVLGVIGSGLAMYLFLSSMFGQKAGIIGGILYMYAPYRFVDMYIRGDIGEHTAFIFIPFVCWGLYQLYKSGNNRYILYAAISFALLILAHNAVSLMMLPLLLCFALYLWGEKKWNKTLLLQLVASFGFGFFLAGFFWIPALLEGQYTLRNIVTKGAYIDRFVSLSQLLWGPWNYGISGMFTVQLGILAWIAFISSCIWVVYHAKNKALRKDVIFLSGLIFFTLAAIFLMLPISNILWSRIMLLQNFQFPWRFLGIPVFTTSVMGGFLITRIPKKQQTKSVVTIAIVLFLLSVQYMHAKAYEQKPESFFTGIYDSTTDTGESSPIWSTRSMDHGFSSPLVTISGNAFIKQEERKSILHEYIVTSSTPLRLLENTLYFPGWKILVDGKEVPIQFQDPAYRGLMTFSVTQGTHTVIVSYTESKLRLLGDIISIIGVIGFVFFWIFSYKKNYL